jgi:hypothetical protein
MKISALADDPCGRIGHPCRGHAPARPDIAHDDGSAGITPTAIPVGDSIDPAKLLPAPSSTAFSTRQRHASDRVVRDGRKQTA